MTKVRVQDATKELSNGAGRLLEDLKDEGPADPPLPEEER